MQQRGEAMQKLSSHLRGESPILRPRRVVSPYSISPSWRVTYMQTPLHSELPMLRPFRFSLQPHLR